MHPGAILGDKCTMSKYMRPRSFVPELLVKNGAYHGGLELIIIRVYLGERLN